MAEIFVNASRLPPEVETEASFSVEIGRELRALFALHRDFRATSLRSLPDLAKRLGIGALYAKDERARWGQGSFKALGGTYAVLSLAVDALRAQGSTITLADILSGRAPPAPQLTFATATAGNHGRAVAYGAQLAGARSIVFVYDGVPEEQIAAIAACGAEIVRVAGDYETAFQAAVSRSRDAGWLLCSDVAYAGYEDIPRRIMQGYCVLADEVREQLDGRLSHLFVQAGAGGLATPLATYFAQYAPSLATIVTEADAVACLLESARAGRAVSTAAGTRTNMGRLECRTPSTIAWPLLTRHAAAFAAVSDAQAVTAVAWLAEFGIETSPTGAAGLAGLMLVAESKTARDALHLGPDASVLIIITEQATEDERKHL